MFKIEDARKLLEEADVFFGNDDDEDDSLNQTLNMNDIWAWGCSDGHYVTDEELPEVAEMFWRYGWAGILYWVSEERGSIKSEFLDINRFIDFVKHEEDFRKSVPDCNDRAYKRITYTLGANEKEGK